MLSRIYRKKIEQFLTDLHLILENILLIGDIWSDIFDVNRTILLVRILNHQDFKSEYTRLTNKEGGAGTYLDAI